MDIDFEKRIAQAYMVKKSRDRYIFERKKDPREAAINMSKRFMERLIFNYSTHYASPNTIYNTLGIESPDTTCYTVSAYLDDLDGFYLPFDRIIPYALQNGHGTLIVYPPTGYAYFLENSWASDQPNYFLKPNVPLINKKGIEN